MHGRCFTYLGGDLGQLRNRHGLLGALASVIVHGVFSGFVCAGSRVAMERCDVPPREWKRQLPLCLAGGGPVKILYREPGQIVQCQDSAFKTGGCGL